MNLIGDLERLFATSLYPNRLPIAIAVAVVGLALVMLARRRGWLAAARRRRGRSAVVVALALAVGLPSAWYLGSPLFIRTTLNEPASAAATPATSSPAPTASPTSASPTSVSPTGASPTGASPTTQPPAASPAAPLANPRTGTFAGADDFHFGLGTATLIEKSSGAWTVRFENFSVRNGPDLYVYVSPAASGYADGAIEVGKLRATDGNFDMDLPPGLDPGAAASIVIWCKQFAVEFATAPLGG